MSLHLPPLILSSLMKLSKQYRGKDISFTLFPSSLSTTSLQTKSARVCCEAVDGPGAQGFWWFVVSELGARSFCWFLTGRLKGAKLLVVCGRWTRGSKILRACDVLESARMGHW
ncbi:hypothetical protein SLEP1_g34754 [Rubroshorea leprosula]|uniref:Uncharacterized protein n=1 Tax=Rubroshorea leprosula TaxID=152421 RepID=A0AAV5KL92_9ROSI|nr:hypothetical protein SLEP1_g34754 [Rubroshorea leprosula]